MQNTASEPSVDINLDLPVDPNLLIDPDSVTSTITIATEFSVVDNPALGQISDFTVTGENGVPRPATPSDVDALRFSIDRLEAGEAATLSYSVRVR